MKARAGVGDVRLRPIRKTSAYEEIVRQIEALVASGELRAGDRLMTERELAEKFGVSRVTVRQALSVLQAMGLIESKVGNGTFARNSPVPTVTVLASVLNPRRSSLLEQLELRRLIEPEVARLAAARASLAQTREMAHHIELQEQMMKQGRPFVEEDSAFHMSIARSSGNELLVRMMESIHELLRDSREQSLRTRSGMARSLDGHRRIIDAIRRADERDAQRAMLKHVLEVEANITEREAHQSGHPRRAKEEL